MMVITLKHVGTVLMSILTLFLKNLCISWCKNFDIIKILWKKKYYQLKLLKIFKMSITNVLHFLIFYLPLPINIDISYSHQHSKEDIPLLSVDVYSTVSCCKLQLQIYRQLLVFILVNIMLAI